ncbi:MAG: FAD-dependent oxidoreductase [Burkholderiales bacterium]|jgi:phytoene dehydrogenase-like protein/ferredoxin-NADP reductase
MDASTTYDAIVIGSGIGGMTAAGLLAGVAGRRVLVLERHTEPGGLTHVFRRDGAAWDVGVHYVGELEPGSPGRAYFDYLSGGRLHWNRMPDAFERFVYPDLDVTVPSDPAAYERTLVDAFPDEAPAIRRYFADIERATKWATLGFVRAMVPRPVEPLLRLVQRLTGRLGTTTTGDYLAKRFRSPRLRALLASQWGDYGLPPSRSAFAIHAQIVRHYLHGAWFPEGGAGRIARSLEPGIERTGGAIRVAQEVTRILVEDGRAVGVEVVDRRGATPCTRTFRAPIVISNAGVPATFERLLPTDGEIGARTAPLRALAARLNASGLSAVTLYLRLKADARTIGVNGENIWISETFDHDDVAAQTRGLLAGEPRAVFVSFPSIKSGEDRVHTAEIIAFTEDAPFAAWTDRPHGRRGADYSALKQRIGEGLLRAADRRLPGLADLVAYAELATPATIEHFTGHPGGRFYGLPATPERYRSTLLGPRTPIEGLYLSGSDAGCLGIYGAMMGGVGAACQVLGARGMPMIRAALKAGPPATAEVRLPEGKRRVTLRARRALTPDIWHLEFEVDGEVGDYAPGQFARLHVGDDEWRDYSIAGLDGRRLRFLIATRTGGHGSRFVRALRLGDTTEIELPLGRYALEPGDRRKVFVATGTGLAPFLPMFESLAHRGALPSATLVFGCRTLDEDITRACGTLPPEVIRCTSRQAAPEGGVSGRVTDALARMDFEPERTEFYLCGSSAMVADCRALLEARGARHLLVEGY